MIKCIKSEYFHGVSKKSGKPYHAIKFIVTNTEHGGAVEMVGFLAPWEVEELGVGIQSEDFSSGGTYDTKGE